MRILIIILFLCSFAHAELPSSVLKSLHEVHVVWVGGFANELARGPYFAPNFDALASEGYLQQAIIYPSSLRSVESNRFVLRDLFLKMYEENGNKPLLIIGHSKGGLEALATVIWDPELIRRGVIRDVITVQSPLRGNSLVDELVGPWLKCVDCVVSSVSPGARSLNTNMIRKMIEDSIKVMTPQDVELLNERIHYVVSSKPRHEMSRLMYQLSGLTKHEQGEFDGLVMKKDMWIPSFGNILMDIQADHLELLLEPGWATGEIPVTRAQKFTIDLVTTWSEKRNGDLCRRALLKK